MFKKWTSWLITVTLFSSLFLGIFSAQATTDAHNDALLPMTFSVIQASDKVITDTLSFEWSTTDIEWQISEQGISASFSDHQMLNIPGQPVLPYLSKTYVPSNNRKISYIQTSSIEYQILPKFKIPIEIAQEPQTISFKEKNYTPAPLSASILSHAVFPENNFEYVEIENEGNYSLQLFIFPFYIIQDQWHLVTSMEIEIGILDTSSHKLFSADQNNDTVYSVILSPDELSSPAQQLKTIHENDGYVSRVVRLSEIRSYPPASIPSMNGIKGFADFEEEDKQRFANYNLDLALRIRSYLADQLKEGTVHYLTLLGDATFIPPSYYVFSNDGMGDYDEWVPTDYFYMAPTADGSKYEFNINVGRLPVRNLQEARNVIDKIARYREALDPSWFQKTALMGGDTFYGDYFAELAMSRAINLDYLNGLEIKKYFKTEGLFTDEPVKESFSNANKGFIWALGHGSGDGLLLEPGFMDSKELMEMPKHDQLPIVISEACGNGAFDSRFAQPDFGTNSYHPYPTSFSEAVVLSDGAGIAYIGGARINYAGWRLRYQNGVPDLMDIYYMDAIIEFFFKQYTQEGGSLGDIARRTMQEYMEEKWSWINAPQIKTFFGFTLQGDPTIKLPKVDYKKDISTSEPGLSYLEDMPKTSRQIPFFSIDDGINVKAITNASSLRYIVADYLDHENPVRTSGNLKNTAYGEFKHQFMPDKKTIMSIRMETEDFKESRIVFYSRYNYDLVVNAGSDLTLLNPYEEKDYAFTVINDGIYEASQLNIHVKIGDQYLKEYFIENLPIMSSRRLFYSFAPVTTGSFDLTMQAPHLKGETMTEDNQVTFDILAVDEPVVRIGVLQESMINRRNYYEQRFMIEKLNRMFREQNKHIEVCVIPFAKDMLQQTTMDRLNIDMLVLYTPYFYNYPMQEALSYLEHFENKGGTVLGIMNLGNNHFGLPLDDVNEYFGISRNEEFTIGDRSDDMIQFQLTETMEGVFTKNAYELSSRFKLDAKKPWSQIVKTGAELMGMDKDEKVALLRYGNRFLYTGFLSDTDFAKHDESLQFFMELLSLPLRERMDVGIRSAYFNQLHSKPDDAIQLIVEYENYGNSYADDLVLLVNDNQEFNLPALKPNKKDKFIVPVAYDGKAISSYHIQIICPQDTNPRNNSKTLFHHFDETLMPDQPPVVQITGTKDRTTLLDQETIKGKITPGAQLYVNQQRVAVNPDGGFTTLLKLQNGIQRFEFVAHHGLKKSQPEEVLVRKQKETIIRLTINDHISFFDNNLHNLGNNVFLDNNITYVPVRFIAEAFGADVSYDATTRSIYLSKDSLNIRMQINNHEAYINGEKIMLEGPPLIIAARTQLPLRFLAEAFGAKVDWDPNLETITLTYIDTDLPEVEALTLEWSEFIDPKDDHFTTIAHGDNQGMLIQPTCMATDDQGNILISSYDGIYRWDEDEDPQKIICTQEWKNKYFDSYYFDRANSFPNQSIFRAWGNKLVFTDGYDMHIIDVEQNQEERMISFVSYGTFLYPEVNYSNIWTFEILGNFAYLLNPFRGITVIDLTLGEVISNFYIPGFPVDFTLDTDYITTVTIYGDIYRLSLVDGKITRFELNDMIFPNSISFDGKYYFIQTLFPSSIIAVELIPERNEVKHIQNYRLSRSPNVCSEQLYFTSSGIYALIFDMETMQSGVAKLNNQMMIEYDTLTSSTEWIKENPQFKLHNNRNWIVDDDHVLISQRSPSDFRTVNLFHSSGRFIRNIPVRLPTSRTQMLDIQYVGHYTLAALLYDGDFMVQTISFENFQRIQYTTTKLINDDPNFYPYFWAVNQDRAAIWNYVSAQVVSFDIHSGKLLNTFNTYNKNEAPNYLSTSRIMRYYNNNLYIFDVERCVVRSFDETGNFMQQWNLDYIKQGEVQFYFDFQVINEDSFALLDHTNAQVLFIKNGAVVNTWGQRGVVGSAEAQCDTVFLSPLSISVNDNSLLINDAGNFRILHIDLNISRDEETKLMVYPKEYNVLRTYPLDWTQTMHIQIINDTSSLNIQHPEGISYEVIQDGQNYKILQWRLDPSFLSSSLSIKGKIVVATERCRIEVPVNIQQGDIPVILYRTLIKKGDLVFNPRLPIEMPDNHTIMDMKTFHQVFGFDYEIYQNDIIIHLPKGALILRQNHNIARLYTSDGMKTVDMGLAYETKKGELLIPINAILELLSIKYDMQRYWIKFNLPQSF